MNKMKICKSIKEIEEVNVHVQGVNTEIQKKETSNEE